ncbi:Uma2 family endonuclease [Oscillatoria sp. CS-180]|uniref:Uma2 family endonuclease n=1 Tax=Oscillatoria sp. CS-180 TaxID=3021720 RepID=UPI00232A9190|nr:Uma2 family endonuclease [Oscillatoria sp. CS-180]MDB9529059.1 Uma2 family endonuclease [Oscillatoria sp. CS-180]
MSQSTVVQDTTNFSETEVVQCPPTDLWSDEPPLESDFHRDQISLLINILRELWGDRQDVYVSGNLTIYYNEQQIKSRDFRGPDFFVVLGTENKLRKSWVVWGEDGRYPNLIVEILSSSTKKVDRGLKKELYQNTFRTPDYFLFDPDHADLEGYHLLDGRYELIQVNERGHLWSQQLELYLGVHEGVLRFFDTDGQLVPTPAELVSQGRQRVEQERQRAEQERQRAEQEQQRAEQERQRAEQERQRAEQAEAELERLKAQLQQEAEEP